MSYLKMSQNSMEPLEVLVQECVGRVLRKVKERKWNREREREERYRTSHLLEVCLILARRHQSCKYHNNSLTLESRSALIRHSGKQPCYIMFFFFFLHHGLNIDNSENISHSMQQKPKPSWVGRTIAETEKLPFQCRQCQQEILTFDGISDFCVIQYRAVRGLTQSFVIISAGNGVLQNTACISSDSLLW